MNNQRILERLLVSELRKRDVLTEVICEYVIENVRECDYCHRLMNEGWMYGGFETFCSDRCLHLAHPEDDLADLKLHAADEDSETYWTAWEG